MENTFEKSNENIKFEPIKNEIIFDENQMKFIKSEINNCAVYGNPGCGKTSSIIQYCIDKNKNHKIKSSEFMIITFSKNAQLDFLEKGIKTKVKIFNNKNIRTIHSLAGYIIFKEFGKTSKSLETIILACHEHIKNEKINLFKYKLLNNLKFMIIDEAQDINENQYNLACIICEKLDIKLILVGDPNQNIYQFQNGTDKFLLNHSKNIFNLTMNYRSTKSIVDFANYIKPHQNLNLMETMKKKGEKPYIYCNNIDNIIEHLLDEITNGEYEMHEIAIIGPVRKSNYIETGKPISIGLNGIINILEEKNILFNKYFNIDNENVQLNSKKKIPIIKNHVNLLTIHSSKGLEFKKTLILNYHLTTYSRHPSLEEYKEFEYLWYVALTRAKEKLIIYMLEDKYIFKPISSELSESNKPYKIFEDKLCENCKINSFEVVNIINNKKYFNENKILEFENNFDYSLEKNKLYDIDVIEITEYDEYFNLYQWYINNIFEYLYYKNKNLEYLYIDKKINEIKKTIIIKKEDKKQFLNNFDIASNFVYLNDKINKSYKKIYDKYFKETNEEIVSFIIENDYCFIDNKYIIQLYEKLSNHKNYEKIMFDITLYFYQMQNECKFLMKKDFSQQICELNFYVEKINLLTKNLNNFEFDKNVKHNNIQLFGIIDIVNNDKIIELKFISSIDIKHIIQVLLYYNLYHQDWNKQKDIEIWNLKDGYKYTVIFSNKFNAWNLNCFLCDTLDIQMKNNIIMFDLETNTTYENEIFSPIEEHEIIDRYFYEYNFNSVLSSGFIKPITSLKKNISELTGIKETDLINADDDYKNIKQDMDNILKYCDKPLFIGHNSENFDLKVLKINDILDINKILSLDSKIFLRQFNVECKTNKLIDHYNCIFETNIIQTHQAKGDTMLIVEICKKLNLTQNKLLLIVN